MNATFVESSEFTEWVVEYLPGDSYVALQRELLREPNCGVVIPGCGGLRKHRFGDPVRGKGKRGGVRIIYLHLPDVRRFYMLDIYEKDEKDDLSAAEKLFLSQLVETLKREARAELDRRKEKPKS